MDPRIQERRDAVVRARYERRLRRAVVVLIAVGLVAAAGGLLETPWFSARHVRVTGAVNTDIRTILQSSGLHRRPALISVSAGAVSTRLDALPWVASSRVEVQWPDSVSIAVVERVPAAVILSDHLPDGDKAALVDRTGRILAWVTSVPPGLPSLVTGDAPPEPGEWVGSDLVSAVSVADALPPALGDAVESIGEGPEGTLTLGLTNQLTANLGSGSELSAKLESLASVLEGASPQGPAVIDVSVPQVPTVTPDKPVTHGSTTN